PDRDLWFGFGPAHEIKRRLLTLWNSIGFLVQYANVSGWEPEVGDLEAGPAAEHPLDRWLVARTHEPLRDATQADKATLTGPGLWGRRRGPLELVHPALQAAVLARRRAGVPHALVRARAVAPDHLSRDAVPRRPHLGQPRPRA